MKLIVGLGNIGRQYAHTRHNIGFMVLDELAREMQASWSSESKLKADIARFELDGEVVLLAKPQTMMNGSGEAVQAILAFYKLSSQDVWVIYDDLDLPLGEVKVRLDGSSGGHQGINSIIRHVGTAFTRIRVGIDPNNRLVEPSEVYVLKAFNTEQRAKLRPVIELAVETTLHSLQTRETLKRTIN